MAMKIINIIRNTILCGTMLSLSTISYGGNGDRVGSAGATQLLVNPWGRSLGFADAGVACGTGLGATFTNIAGLAFTPKTQIMFDRTNWLGNAGIALNAFGLAQRINESTVFSVAIISMNYGDIDITTVDQPEGGIGEFSPRSNNFNVGIAHAFSNSIYAGINFKVVTESISNIKGTGIGMDIGIKYVTGEQDHIKFGITLKNVGPTMSFRGDGLSTAIVNPDTEENATLEQRTDKFELPSLLALGASYDFNLTETDKLTIAAAFSANSFSYDQFKIGADFGKEIGQAAFHIMAGFIYEKGVFNKDFELDDRATSLSGLTAGVSIDAIVGKNKNNIGFQYAFRSTSHFSGIHTIGMSIDLK